MSALVKDAEVTDVSLVPEKNAQQGAPGLGRVTQRYASGLSAVATSSILPFSEKLSEMGLPLHGVSAGNDLDTKAFEGWCEEQQDNIVLFHYRAAPMGDGIVLALPALIINRLVDIHFGGNGESDKQSTDFSPAEQIFLGRFAKQFASALDAGWAQVLSTTFELSGIATSVKKCRFLKPHELVTVQPYQVNLGENEEAEIKIIYPFSGLKAVPALADFDGMSGDQATDPAWQAKVKDAIMQMHMPLRTIFARPEISLRQLMQLKTGDVIPVFMPNHIPVSVSGRLFAHGTVGESSNRIAIKIEEIEKGKKS